MMKVRDSGQQLEPAEKGKQYSATDPLMSGLPNIYDAARMHLDLLNSTERVSSSRMSAK
jgi:hypothetical protein